MIDVRKFDSLGGFTNDWLKARHHFSFANYHDPNRMGWGPIRVWNDDEIAPGAGFDPHPHRDMEIITYVREGAITHRDHMGNEGRTVAGDVQVMSAGKGVVHAEYNKEKDPTRIFQIWIEPTEHGGDPAWATAEFPKGDRAGELTVLASGRKEDQSNGALPIRTNARVFAGFLRAGDEIQHDLPSGKGAYLVPATGRLVIGEESVDARDGVAIRDVDAVTIRAKEDSEIVLVEA